MKVYEEVLKQIQTLIYNKKLSPGDRLPSERELAEQLNAGRSSVREALRAIELLGLIETRRGEGTFLRTYRTYHLVELLASFILQEPKSKQEILLSKRILEKEAVKLAIQSMDQKNIEGLQTVLHQEQNQQQKHYAFFSIIFSLADNYLLQKIWEVMEQFSHTINEYDYNDEFYHKLLIIYKNQQLENIEDLFNNLSLN